jgi:transcriptional regulator with XRE-family HTH domain
MPYSAYDNCQRPVCEISLPGIPHKTPFLRALGRAVREQRERRRLSRVALAVAVGVEEQRIRALERGELDPGYELLVALADALGVQSGALVTRAEELAEEASPGP